MRRITSIILLLAFIIVSVSGIHMVLVPKPQNIQQQMLGKHDSDKLTVRGEMPFYPKKAHEWSGYILIVAGLVHLGLNRKPMLSYFRRRN
jgi:cytochrome b561